PHFSYHVGGSYRTASARDVTLETDTWHHVAGVYDGSEVRIYVDGELRARADAPSGKRQRSDLPFIIGADVNRNGQPTSHFDGVIDAVRLSSMARYLGESFEPQWRFADDAETVLLLNMDGTVGPWLYEESSSGAHGTIVTPVSLVPAE
ncbi:MAG: LamG domain-containing protein, partial [Planctomycetota bacterium]